MLRRGLSPPKSRAGHGNLPVRAEIAAASAAAVGRVIYHSVDGFIANPVQCKAVPADAHVSVHEYQDDPSALRAGPEQTMHLLVPYAINHHHSLPYRRRQHGITQPSWIPSNPLLPDLLQQPTLRRQAERLGTMPHRITETHSHTAEPFNDAPAERGLAGAHWPSNQDHPPVC